MLPARLLVFAWILNRVGIVRTNVISLANFPVELSDISSIRQIYDLLAKFGIHSSSGVGESIRGHHFND